jgi:hypothetical protein
MNANKMRTGVFPTSILREHGNGKDIGDRFSRTETTTKRFCRNLQLQYDGHEVNSMLCFVFPGEMNELIVAEVRFADIVSSIYLSLNYSRRIEKKQKTTPA